MDEKKEDKEKRVSIPFLYSKYMRYRGIRTPKNTGQYIAEVHHRNNSLDLSTADDSIFGTMEGFIFYQIIDIHSSHSHQYEIK